MYLPHLHEIYTKLTMSHAVFFAHGFTPFGAWHNENMQGLLQPKCNADAQIYPLQSLVSSLFLMGSLFNMIWGVDYCSNQYYHEIRHIISSNPKINKISFLGSSMGGINLRDTIRKLYRASNIIQKENPDIKKLNDDEIYIQLEVCGFRKVKLHNYITLASPHMGVVKETFWTGQFIYDLLSKWLPVARDLAPENIMKFASNDTIEGLQKFKRKVLITGQLDDGVVSPGSAIINYESISKSIGTHSDLYHRSAVDLDKIEWDRISIPHETHKTVSRLGPRDGGVRKQVAHFIMLHINE